MLVGCTSLSNEKLLKIYRNPEALRHYSNSLIPEEFRHVKELQDNQLYFVCMTLRKLGIKDYKELQKTIHELLKGLRVTGYVNDVVEVSFLYNIVNKSKVELYLERL